MRIICIFLLLNLNPAFGQLQFNASEVTTPENKPELYTGVVVENYKNGSPKLWREEKDSKADGLWKEWYPNGTLRYRAWWKNGLGHGKWEYFYPNGQLRSESFYIQDIAQGLYLSYHENGQLAQQSVYLNGQLDGLYYEYDVNGIPLSRKRYREGVRLIDEPVLFQPGIIATETANEWDITFTPDGNTAYFTRRLTDGSAQKIYQSTKNDQGQWVEPKIASFSTDRDEGGFISPDGQYFFFASCRPVAGKQAENSLDMNIWMMTRTTQGWSMPMPLSEGINQRRLADDDWPTHYEAGPSIDKAGKLFYWTRSTTAPVSNLFQSQMKPDGEFSNSKELLPPSHNNGFDSSPYIAPSGDLLFFTSSNREESFGQEDLYYSRFLRGQWTEPKNLGPTVNSNFNESAPRFSPDGKYLFFTSDRADQVDPTGERLWSIYYMETQFLSLD
ncbi:hypothetical protein [Croceiramulus getboli]|nr:hypothetical protein P8624_07965 [Flavobacteriaceae bacterium YJPT1-3]